MTGYQLDERDKVGIAAPTLFSLSFVAAAFAILSTFQSEWMWALTSFILANLLLVMGFFSSSVWRNHAAERRRRFEEQRSVSPKGARPPAYEGGTEPLRTRDLREPEATTY